MSSPALWIFVPLGFALALVFLVRWPAAVKLAAAAGALILALLALWLPVGERVSLGPLSLQLADVFFLFGRRLLLEDPTRPILVLIYAGLAFWIIGSLSIDTSRWFAPMALVIGALLTAAIAVRPFLYAALFIELCVLLSIPVLTGPASRSHRGVLRYLTLLSLGMPLILFSGWILSSFEGSSLPEGLVIQVGSLIGVGFAILLAVIPLHSWMPMLMEEAQPYISAFLMYTLPLGVMLFGVTFFDRYAWLRQHELTYPALQALGLVGLLAGGAAAGFQRHLGRVLAYAVVLETGNALLAVSLASTAGWQVFFALFLPRCLALALWALSLSVLREQYSSLQLTDLSGAARRHPLASMGVILANLSFAGLPLLAGFPGYYILWNLLVEKTPGIGLLLLIGNLGLLLAALRALSVLLAGSEQKEQELFETAGQRLLLITGSAVLLLAGLFPQLYLPYLFGMIQAFTRLIP